MPTGAAGTTLTLDAVFSDGTGQAVVPVTPLVSILDPNGATIISNAVPTATPTLGRYEYDFAIPSGPLGSWTAHWTGTINGVFREADEVFTVVDQGSIVFDPLASPVGPCEVWPYSEQIVCSDPIIEAAATEVLWALSGHRYGICTVTINPGLAGLGGCWGVQFRDVNGLRVPYQETWGACCGRRACACSTLGSEIRVPGPVVELTSVTLDGESIAVSGVDAGVRVNDRRSIELLDSSLSWPECSAEDTVVVYTRGRPVPASGQMAMGELITELCASQAGQPCSLPARVREITINQQTIAMLDPLDFLEGGRTGLPKVDLFLLAVNPKGLRRRGRVYRADAQRNRRIGT